MKNIIFFLLSIVLCSCEKEQVSLLDETLLLGRWEPGSKSIVYKDGRDEFTNDEVCEWYDTYTFFENGRLRYVDGVKVEEGLCGNNPELEIEGKWNQGSNGKFTFTITKTDGTQLIKKPKDFYFEYFGEDVFLTIEYYEEDPNSNISYYYTSFNKLE